MFQGTWLSDECSMICNTEDCSNGVSGVTSIKISLQVRS